MGTVRLVLGFKKISLVGCSSREVGEAHPDLLLKHYHAIEAIANETKWAAVQLGHHARPRGWQKEIRDHLMCQDDRRICFVIDEKGGAGKSSLAKQLMAEFKCWYTTGGTQNNLACSYKEPDYEVAIFDLSRNPQDKDFHPYTFAEQLKNGLFTSGKYMSCFRKVTPPKVIWFANQDPDRSKLTDDRYCVHIVDKDRSNMALVEPPPEDPDPLEDPLDPIVFEEVIPEPEPYFGNQMGDPDLDWGDWNPTI